MATPFTSVYDAFLANISDADLLGLEDTDLDDLLEQYLNKAQAEFERICVTDLTDRNETSKQYNNALSLSEIEILALGMMYFWLRQKVMFADNLKLFMNTKDFNMASPANMLKELNSLYKTARYEFQQAMIVYSYANGAVETLYTT